MPIKPFQSNPLRHQLPSPVRKGIDFLFPEDDPLAGASMVEMPIEGIATNLRPLLNGGLDRGRELAAELMQRAQPVPNDAKGVTMRALAHVLNMPLPEPNYAAQVGMDKVTAARPIAQNLITAPEGFSFGINSHGNPRLSMPSARSDSMSTINKIWNQVTDRPVANVNKPIKSATEAPQLSRRIGTNQFAVRVREQNRLLQAMYPKGPVGK